MKTSLRILAAIVLLLSISGISMASPLCHMASEVRYAGFVSHDDFDKYYQFVVDDKDFTAADNFLIDSITLGTALLFEKGEAVYVEDTEWLGPMQVRRPGETESYWTFPDAAKCPQ